MCTEKLSNRKLTHFSVVQISCSKKGMAERTHTAVCRLSSPFCKRLRDFCLANTSSKIYWYYNAQSGGGKMQLFGC